MTWVKICGITNLEDALIAVEAGADALGFVFHEKSPRYVKPETARAIGRQLPAFVERVGVFGQELAPRIDEVVESAGVTAAQLLGRECVAEFVARLETLHHGNRRPRVIKVISANELSEGSFFISEELKDSLYALLVDSISETHAGGTGKAFDWEKVRPMIVMLNGVLPTVVAGGLTSTNVVTAIQFFHPWGVDVSSGVEARPGKKDPEKVWAFVQAVRDADSKVS